MPGMSCVLLAVNEADTAVTLERMLNELDHDVLSPVASGRNAVILARERQPDVVILDTRLTGEVDALTAAVLIQAFLDAPIVYLTGGPDEAALSEALSTDPSAFLVRPVSRRELRACLETVLRRHEMERRLRDSEERYRHIVEHINDALLLYDSAGRIIDVNEHCCRMFGYARGELVGADTALLSNPEPLGSQTQKHAELRQGPAVVFETTCMDRNGRTFPVEVSARMITRAPAGLSRSLPRTERGNGEHPGTWGRSTGVTQCLLRDIRERKEQERRLREAKDHLEQALAEKEKLFSVIAHDLRSPLVGLLVFTRMLAEKVDLFTAEELRKCAKDMKQSAEGLHDLLENLLEWSSLKRGALPFAPEPMTLAEPVKQNLGLFRALSEQKKIALESHVPEKLMVNADSAMLKILLRNLLANALKFSRQGGRVRIQAETDEKMVTVCVRDDGVGMEEDLLDGLFRQNTIQSRRGTDGEKGTGLGLVLCAEVVQRLGGEIWAQSRPGQGTTFFFTLPAARPEGQRAQSSRSISAAHAPDRPRIRH